MRNLLFFIASIVLICVTGCQNTGTNSHKLTQAQKDSIEQARLVLSVLQILFG